MIFIKSKNGKTRLIESILSEDREDIVISIGEPDLVFADYIVDKLDLDTVNEMSNFISEHISELCRYIIIYTNMDEQEIQPYISIFEKLEDVLKGMIYNCILMHK